MNVRRLDAAAGPVAGVLIYLGFALAGPAPAPAEPAAELARHLSDNRTRILTGDLLIGSGALFYIWFLAALRTHLDTPPRAERTLSAAAFAAGCAGVTLVVAGVALQSGLVVSHETLADNALVRLGFDGYNAVVTIAGFCFAMTVAAASGSAARSGKLSRRLQLTGWVTAGLQLATLPGLVVTDGPFAPAGPVPVFAFSVLTIWSVAVSVALMRAAADPEPQAAPA